ncbi:MAG: colanic acid biosynthesis glycosyltransferase WcaL, partial [Dolichospermum sp.]
QCSATDIRGGGGIETYIASLVNSEILGVSNHHINSFQNLDQGQCKLLHLHDPEFLAELRGECPAIFTLHNHCSYCPSGTKYLANRQQKCDRNMDFFGCNWGHLVDGCGSRRPEKIWQDWQSSYD